MHYPIENSKIVNETVIGNEKVPIAEKSKSLKVKVHKRIEKGLSAVEEGNSISQNDEFTENTDIQVEPEIPSLQNEATKTYMKVYVLVEDTTTYDLKCEHGLSFYIEYNDKKILLDAGQTEIFAENAENMLVDLSKIDFAVLSHAHYDHSGGFATFFDKNVDATVYARKEITEEYYCNEVNYMRDISVPYKIWNHKERFTFINESIKISNGIYLVGHSNLGLSSIGFKHGLYRLETDYSEIVDSPSPYFSDDFKHEHSLVFDTQKGVVIFNSCSHGGVENIIKEVKNFCGNKPIYAYIGGFHMKKTVHGTYGDSEECYFSDDEIAYLCNFIKEQNIAHVYTGHCTGEYGFKKLQEQLGDIVKHLKTGMVFEL